ncbi:MAG: precorrin-4 C(11)-methyltransferase [Alistipes sp.]|nr:precorrin-4 C(11)-methyltransferase [Alistipes sp.]
MNRNDTAILLISEQGLPVARAIAAETGGIPVHSATGIEGTEAVPSVAAFAADNFADKKTLIFVGAVGICVRAVAPCVRDKHTDPAVVCVDSTGRYVVPILSGHVGGANEAARRLASLLGAEAVVTTQSDNASLWALDTLAARYGWRLAVEGTTLNAAIARFVNGRPTLLLLDTRDEGTRHLERTCPAHVRIIYRAEELPTGGDELLIAVSPRTVPYDGPRLRYVPQVLHLGIGCRKGCAPEGIAAFIGEDLRRQGYDPAAIASLATIELKRDEPLLEALREAWPEAALHIYTAEQLEGIEVPNPSEKVREVTGVGGVAESAARRSAGLGPLAVEKRKGQLTEGNDFTYAAALDLKSLRCGHIEIVGAGPGDPDLISVRGRRFLEEADLILYAGSLVPREVTACAKTGAVVRSSASMTLEEQFALMKESYDRGELVVRLHTGDPCIYGAIQEQMAFFDRYGMRYHITPGISSFLAAAAELQSQFTIPEKVQTIILTRGEGRTPMPEREQLRLLARSQSTMCIFLSAGVADQVQRELLEHYPPQTPVAVCHHLTWPDQRIWRGELQHLAEIVRENKLTLTTMIVVGEAIDNRKGLSRLYSSHFKHLFRP